LWGDGSVVVVVVVVVVVEGVAVEPDRKGLLLFLV